MEVPSYLQHTTGALPAQPDFIDELPPSQEAEVRAYAPFYPFSTKKKSWNHVSDINSHQRLREEKCVQCKQNEITLVAFIHFRMVASPTSQVENLPKTKALDVHLWAGLDPPRLAAVVYVSQIQ